MFQDLGRGGGGIRLHGDRGSLLWGYRTAALLPKWHLLRIRGGWQLRASVGRFDAFQCRQKPLLFSAPRMDGKGLLSFPVVKVVQADPKGVIADLGSPEF